MKQRFDDGLQAQVTVDDEGRVRQINHFGQMGQPQTALTGSARDVADAYVKSIASEMDVPEERLAAMQEPASYLSPQPQDVQYRLAEEKTLLDSTTFGSSR